MSKEPPLYLSEGSHCFWQAFVFVKYTGDIETCRKKMLKSDKMVLCENSSFLRTKSSPFSLKCDLEASWLFLFLVIKRYFFDTEEKGGKAEFLCSFFVHNLPLKKRNSFNSTFPIGQLRFLGATVSS